MMIGFPILGKNNCCWCFPLKNLYLCQLLGTRVQWGGLIDYSTYITCVPWPAKFEILLIWFERLNTGWKHGIQNGGQIWCPSRISTMHLKPCDSSHHFHCEKPQNEVDLYFFLIITSLKSFDTFRIYCCKLYIYRAH